MNVVCMLRLNDAYERCFVRPLNAMHFQENQLFLLSFRLSLPLECPLLLGLLYLTERPCPSSIWLPSCGGPSSLCADDI